MNRGMALKRAAGSIRCWDRNDLWPSSVAADGVCRFSVVVSMAIDVTGQREEVLGSAANVEELRGFRM